jgi:pyruvate dehydrogenase phosphatase
MAYKLHRAYTRVFTLLDPPYKTRAAKIEDWVPRNLTPPYLTARADVVYRALDVHAHEYALVLASDGLTDLLSPAKPVLTPELVRTYGAAAAAVDDKPNALAANAVPDTLAARLLQAAMGGNDLARASQFFTVEMDGSYMDDTTLVALRL